MCLANGASAPARTWTNARVTDWQERFDAACRELEGPRRTVGQRRRFAVYRDASMRPSPVMVWTPAQAGQYVDAIADHRLYPLFHLIVFRGFRRGEVCGLRWRDVDLDTARITVTSARVQLGWEAVESPVKSAASDGVLAIDADTVAVLKAWRRTQLAERLAEDVAKAVPRRRQVVAGDSGPTDAHTSRTRGHIEQR